MSNPTSNIQHPAHICKPPNSYKVKRVKEVQLLPMAVFNFVFVVVVGVIVHGISDRSLFDSHRTNIFCVAM